MDISKASNFERYVCDIVGRDASTLRGLWERLDREGVFDLSGTPYFANVRETGFVSGTSTHANRLETIRHIYRDFGVMVDPHTADGINVGLEHREPGVPLVCLETALPAKFAETIREALGRDPELPPGCEDLESLPQRCDVMDVDAETVKRYIAAHTGL